MTHWKETIVSCERHALSTCFITIICWTMLFISASNVWCFVQHWSGLQLQIVTHKLSIRRIDAGYTFYSGIYRIMLLTNHYAPLFCVSYSSLLKPHNEFEIIIWHSNSSKTVSFIISLFFQKTLLRENCHRSFICISSFDYYSKITFKNTRT